MKRLIRSIVKAERQLQGLGADTSVADWVEYIPQLEAAGVRPGDMAFLVKCISAAGLPRSLEAYHQSTRAVGGVVHHDPEFPTYGDLPNLEHSYGPLFVQDEDRA